MQYDSVKGKAIGQLLGGRISRLLQSPVAVLSALVLTIFIAEAAIMGLLHLVPGLPRVVESWLDSTLLIIVLYPWLIFLVKRPFLFHIEEREQLEQRVEERTAELLNVNKDLRRSVSAHMRAEEELLHSRAQLQNLSAGLQSLMEEERTRISREIHDELGQSLTALKFDLSAMGKKLPEDQTLLTENTGAMVKLVDSIIKAVQRISLELRPGLLDDLGLVAAIEWKAKKFHQRTGIPCRVILDPRDMDIDPERSTAIFRIFQEALTNIVRHAVATKVEANLEDRDGMLTLEVGDNGRGITEEQASGSKSLGLIGIRERVRRLEGEVLIDGSPHAGTVIRVNIPSTGTRVDVPSTGSLVITT